MEYGFAPPVVDQPPFAALQGIEVTVQPGSGTANNLKLVAAGQAAFAVIDMTGGIQARAAGNTAFRVVSAIYQRSVSCILAFAGRGISTPKDLEGKKVGYSAGGVNYTLFPAYARLAGVDAGKVQWQQMVAPALRPVFATGQVDAITEVTISAGAVKTLTGRDVVLLPYSQFLGDLYGNVLATSAAIAAGNPGLVRRFTTAMTQALQYAIGHPEEAGTVLNTHVKEYPATAATSEVQATETYIRSGLGIGAIEERRVAQSIAILQGAGLIPPGLTPADVLAVDLLPDPARPTG